MSIDSLFFCSILFTFIFILYFLFSFTTIIHKYTNINKIAIFLKYKIAILDIAVKHIIRIFEILFTISSDSISLYLNLIIPFKILPPSNGYNGIKLNNAIRIFEYIIICLISLLICKALAITQINIFVKGPASAIMIFLNSISFLYPYASKVRLIPKRHKA